MAAKPLPCPTMLRLLLRYEPETGKLFWRERKPWMFGFAHNRTCAHKCNNWNSLRSGKEAYTALHSSGYRQGSFLGVRPLAHRVAWALFYGKWPAFDIDHINGVRTDNRIENLREVSRQDNLRNQIIRSDNTSGVTGVHWASTEGCWIAQIGLSGRPKHLGRYQDFSLAVAARKAAERRYGFAKTHGMAQDEREKYAATRIRRAKSAGRR